MISNTTIILFLAAILGILIFIAFIARKSLWNLHSAISDIRRTVNDLTLEQKKSLDFMASSSQETVNATCLTSLGFKYPVFFGGPSIDTHHARMLLFILQENKPKNILELGSGSSSVLIARALQLMNAPANIHISVDHEDRFLRNTQELARLNEVDHLIRFEHCPLSPIDGADRNWYSGVPELISSIKLDLVIVDGPPAYTEKEKKAREPALPVLREYLSDKAIIILDDANRAGERSVVETWLAMYPELQLHHASESKGMAILTIKR